MFRILPRKRFLGAAFVVAMILAIGVCFLAYFIQLHLRLYRVELTQDTHQRGIVSTIDLVQRFHEKGMEQLYE
jgi:multidrug resistance efflux pump